jgi:SOS-response transcriptional repressor LexA
MYKNKFTARYLSEQINVPETTISTWRYKRTIPRADQAVKIAQFLDTTVEYLITGEYEGGLTQEQREMIQTYYVLDERGKQTVQDLIDSMYKRQQEAWRKEHLPDIPENIQVPDDFGVSETEPKYLDFPQKGGDRVIFHDWGVVMIPYYGKTAAGRPVNITAEPEYHYPFPEIAIHGDINDYYCLTVCGTSMTEAGIYDGDMALIRHTEEPENGEIMLVRYGNESTLKKIRIRREAVYLCWEDGTGQEIRVDNDEYEIQGKLVNMWRKPKKR